MSLWFSFFQICFDLFLLALLFSVLRARNKNRGAGKPVSGDSTTQASQQENRYLDDLRHMEDLQDSLEKLIERVEQTTAESFTRFHETIQKAEATQNELSQTINQGQTLLDEQHRCNDATIARQSEQRENLAPRTQSSSAENGRTEGILQMYDQGATVDEIARKLEVGRGEVHLVLDLHRAKQI